MRFDSRNRSILFALVLLVDPFSGRCDEAIDVTGRRYSGCLRLVQDKWEFTAKNANQQIPVEQLAYVRFDPKGQLPVAVRPSKTFLLPGGQRITGSLVRVDGKAVELKSSWGETHTLKRGQLSAIVHANDWLPLLHEEWDELLKGWQTDGKPNLDARVTFCGKCSLRLDTAGQRLIREWPAVNSDSQIALVFQRSPAISTMRWTIDALLETKHAERIPTLLIDHAGIRIAGIRENTGSLKLTPGWHALILERQDGVMRFFVDDLFLGKVAVPRDAGLKGIRLSATRGELAPSPGDREQALWVDAVQVAQRLPAAAMPANNTAADFLWLIHGEQIFGRIVAADARSVVLEGKPGKLTIAWARLRGIGFAESAHQPALADAEIYVRSSLGYLSDILHAKLLRWDDEKLIARHASLGELALARNRLEKIRFERK